MIETLISKVKFPCCIERKIIEDNKENINIEEYIKKTLGKTHLIKCVVINNGKDYNYKKTKIKDIYAVGNSLEECFHIVFKQTQSLYYCNDISINIENKEEEEKYNDFYYGENGLVNYVKSGGSMN